MKKRIAIFGVILSLIPIGQPLIIKTGVVLFSTGLIISLPEKVNAESAEFYLNQGIDEAKKGNIVKGKNLLEKSLQINPKNVDTLYNLALIFQNLNNQVEAINLYTKALKINSKLPAAYKNLGNIYFTQKEYELATNNYLRSLELYPDSINKAELYYFIGRIKLLTRQYEEAIFYYNKSIFLNPNNFNAVDQRGIAKHAGRSDVKGACKDYLMSSSLGSEYRQKWFQSESNFCGDI
tara:strand:+ start:301 stop:1008 length:708 start_codon:yes stop_codon:yes gene_type:complete